MPKTSVDTSNDNVDKAAKMIRTLAEAGILDRCFQIKVGDVEVNLGPADMDTAVAAIPEGDPRRRIIMQLLGPGRSPGVVG